VRHCESQPEAGFKLVEIVLQLNPQIEAQKWDFLESRSSLAIDFAAIYHDYYISSKVPQLFDDLIAHLETIINSGEIDSLHTINALERLLTTVRKNARGDYFASRGTWEFTQVFFKNLSVEAIESLPGLRQVSKGLRKTLSDLDLEMSQVLQHGRRQIGRVSLWWFRHPGANCRLNSHWRESRPSLGQIVAWGKAASECYTGRLDKPAN
jgi:hypothetical protein